MFNGIDVATGLARPVNSWNYDRVELLGGLSSLRNGAGSVGGSLIYITRRASREKQDAEGRISYGSFDTTQTAFGVNHGLSDPNSDMQHFARLDVSHAASNGYIDQQENDAWSVAFSLLSDVTPNLSHTWRWNIRTNTKTARIGVRRCSTPRQVN